MGTNYYWNRNCCEACGRLDRVHIGKSSAGWEFHFRGYKKSDLSNPDDPKALVVESFADWRRLLQGQKIKDEYGDDVTPETMIQIAGRKGEYTVEATGEKRVWLNPLLTDLGVQRIPQSRYSPSESALESTRQYTQRRIDIGTMWNDAEGYTFSSGEFS